jgi:hypothetical protein
MIEQKTIVDQIEIAKNGVVQVRFAKQLVRGDRVLSSEWHRTAFEPGIPAEAQIWEVNRHLSALECAAVPDSEAAKILSIVQHVHTDECIAQFRAAQIEAQSKASEI